MCARNPRVSETETFETVCERERGKLMCETKVSRREAEPGLASPRFANAASVRDREPWVCARLRLGLCV